MTAFCCFNIGTGHNRNEKGNLLVRLYDDCLLESSYKLINDGVGSKNHATGLEGKSSFGLDAGNTQGWGIKDLTDNAVRHIKGLAQRPHGIFLAGHSRGAILSVRIASKLFSDNATSGIPVHLFLLDPVLQSGLGTAFNNQEIHPNVQNIRIVVAEDLGNKTMFPLKVLSRRPARNSRKERVEPASYIRIPGSHGTGSQSAGGPIGILVYELARKEMSGWAEGGRLFKSDLRDSASLCRLYSGIHSYNRVVKEPVGRLGRFFGKTELKRRVNDEDAKGKFNEVRTDSRAKALTSLGVTNRFRGDDFFVNEHHFQLFREMYPKIAAVLGQLEDRRGVPVTQQDLLGELGRFKDGDTYGWAVLRRACPELANLVG